MPIKKIPSDLLVVLIWTIVTSIFAITPIDNSIIRTILGIFTVLFVPGYVLVAILFPKKDDLGNTERVALSLGMSIVTVPLLGLILNFTVGIELISVVLISCLYTTIMVFGAVYRREKLSIDEKFSINFRSIFYNIITNINLKSRIDRLLILTIIFTIGMVYFSITTPKIGETFTEFYVLNASGKMNNYQTDLKVNYPVTYLIGVENHEYMPVNYTINIVLGQKVLASQDLILDHDEIWKKDITVIPDVAVDNKLEFLLFKENNLTEPYRKLYLRVNSDQKQNK